MKRSFDTVAVAGTITGVVLVEGGMRDIHDVLEHLFPGIGPAGAAFMYPTAAVEIGRQVPALKEFVEQNELHLDYRRVRYIERLITRLGPTLELDGPWGSA